MFRTKDHTAAWIALFCLLALVAQANASGATSGDE